MLLLVAIAGEIKVPVAWRGKGTGHDQAVKPDFFSGTEQHVFCGVPDKEISDNSRSGNKLTVLGEILDSHVFFLASQGGQGIIVRGGNGRVNRFHSSWLDNGLALLVRQQWSGR